MKKLTILILAVFLFIIGSLGIYIFFTNKNTVTFNDPSLEQSIRDNIGKTSGKIQASDLEEITTINLSHSDIRDLNGIEYLTNLKVLDLSGNNLKSIVPLKALEHLTDLNLSMNVDISDVSPLSQMETLEKLDLEHTSVSDIQALKDLKKLTDLNLSKTNIDDLSPLVFHNQLKNLSISRCENIDDQSHLEVLETLEMLTSFEAFDCNMTQIYFLDKLTHLKKLGLTIRKSYDMSVFSDLIVSDLTLSLYSNVDLSFLSNLNYLSKLTIDYDGTSSLEPISHLKKLKKLNIFGYVYRGRGTLKELTFLENLTNLEELNLSTNEIKDITPLKYLVNLRRLDLSNNMIKDITALEDLTNLEYLDLSRNQISVINSLKKLNKLIFLDLSSNQIVDKNTLDNLTQIKKLIID